MTEVLIVSKTRMRGGQCIGGLVLRNDQSVRLLSATCETLSADKGIEIGQVWDLQFSVRSNLTLPHSEDVCVRSGQMIRTQDDLPAFLKSHIVTCVGSPHLLFDQKVRFTSNKKAFITKDDVPAYSTGFWECDRDLILDYEAENNTKPIYGFQDRHGWWEFKAPYVGWAPPANIISAGKLIRVSLARWWQPQGAVEQRCYMQISGWY